jgi:hypothetical protein
MKKKNSSGKSQKCDRPERRRATQQKRDDKPERRRARKATSQKGDEPPSKSVMTSQKGDEPERRRATQQKRDDKPERRRARKATSQKGDKPERRKDEVVRREWSIEDKGHNNERSRGAGMQLPSGVLAHVAPYVNKQSN